MDKHMVWMLMLMIRNQQNHTVGNLTLFIKICNFKTYFAKSQIPEQKKLLVLLKELDVEVKYYIENIIKLAAL